MLVTPSVRFGAVIFLALATVGCQKASSVDSGTAAGSPGGTPVGDTTTTGSTGTGGVSTSIPDLDGHLAGFDIRHVKEQGYWYSRYNLGSLVMKSGNGATFMPDMTLMGAAVDMVSDSTSQATPPANAALLQRLYTVGNPSFVNAGDNDPMDLMDERWEAARQTNSTAGATGWTMIKEVEWAKQFHVDSHFGAPDDSSGIPGAMERFKGMVMFMSAAMQANEWMMNPSAFDTASAGEQYVMLAALSDLSSITTATTLPHTTNNRYRMAAGMMATGMGMADADELGGAFLMGADGIYAADPAVSSIQDRSLAIQGLAWYAVASSANRTDAVARLTANADALLTATASTPVDHAAAIRGLIGAARITGDSAYTDAAMVHYDALLDDFDWTTGTFTSMSTYTTDDVGILLGGLNAVLAYGDTSEDTVIPLIEHFFEAVVNLSGMQVSAPPMSSLAAYEQFGDELFHRYPTLPLPPAAGGDNTLGIAPVSAASVTLSGGTWTAETTSFDTAGAMHLANEMLWMHVDEVNGFPELP